MTKHVEQRHHALRISDILQKDLKKDPQNKITLQIGTIFLPNVVDYQNTHIG